MGEVPKVEKHHAYLGIEPPVSREHAAEVLGISVRGLDRLVAAGDISHERLGRRVILRASYLIQFIEAKKIKARGKDTSTLARTEKDRTADNQPDLSKREHERPVSAPPVTIHRQLSLFEENTQAGELPPKTSSKSTS